jgi:hypothetical protein
MLLLVDFTAMVFLRSLWMAVIVAAEMSWRQTHQMQTIVA